MRGLKDKGIEDLNAVKTRARKMHAMDRISSVDLIAIERAVSALEVIIIRMTERDANGEEVG